MYSLESLFKEFVFYSKLRGLAPKTVKKLRVHLDVFHRYLASEEVETVSQLNHLVIRRFLYHILEEGQAESTVNTYLRTIRAFFVFCIKEEIIDYRDNPCLKVDWIKEPYKVIKPYSEQEVIDMIKWTDRSRTQKQSTHFSRYISARNALATMIMADTGVRVTEMCNIKEDDFSEAGILVKKGKGKKHRVLYSSDLIVKQYLRYKRYQEVYFKSREIKDHEDYLLLNKEGNAMNDCTIQRLVIRAARLAGVSNDVRASPHTFRHFAAQQLLLSTENIYTVSKILGHSRVSTSEAYLKSISSQNFIDSVKDRSPLSSKAFK